MRSPALPPAMDNQNYALVLFNKKLDGLVENFMTNKSAKPELKTEYVRFANICRRVAVYDVDLAWEVYATAMTFGAGFAMWAFEFK